MPPEQAIQNVPQAFANDPALNVLVAAELAGDLTIQRLNLRQDLAAEFLAAAQAASPDANMRQIPVDYARRHRASKRGSGVCMLTLDDVVAQPQRNEVDVIALNDALNTLFEIDARQSRVVELRFFAGLSLEETSEVMGIGTATVQRDWTAARAWLHREISRRNNP